MDDNEYPPDSDYRPHLNLERHLTVGPHIYQITASGTGDERVGLTLVGWNPAGEVVSEISGGISPADLAPVSDALTSTLAGLAALRRQRLSSAPGRAAAAGPLPKRHRNQGVRWSAQDDERLAARHRAGAGPRELMGEFGRSRGGIVARLEHLGLIAADGSAVRAGRSARASAEGPAVGAGRSAWASAEGSAGVSSAAPAEGPVGVSSEAPAGVPAVPPARVPAVPPARVPAGVPAGVPVAVSDAGAAGEVVTEAA